MGKGSRRRECYLRKCGNGEVYEEENFGKEKLLRVKCREVE